MTQVVDARAGPGFKMTKPKKIKNGDGKKKSKLKKLHKLKRQSKLKYITKQLACVVRFRLYFKNLNLSHKDYMLLLLTEGKIKAQESA